MKKFRFLRAVNKSYEQQGEIFFVCANIEKKSERERRRVLELCLLAAGPYAAALWDLMCTTKEWQQVCDEHFISPETLIRCRRRFYNIW